MIDNPPVVPRDIWYVLPVEACMPSPMLRFYPDGARCARFEQYREAWHLLRARPEPHAAPFGGQECPPHTTTKGRPKGGPDSEN